MHEPHISAAFVDYSRFRIRALYTLLNKSETAVNRETRHFYIKRSLARREGFEPSEPLGSTVLETGAINHSANAA